MSGFHRDADGDWIADLSCLHSQHVRHRPPFAEAAWIEDERQRQSKIGAPLDCPLCERTELPDGLRLERTTPTWDHLSLPAALLRSHRVAAGVWGLLQVEAGRLRFVAETEPRLDVVVEAGSSQPIPPDVEHRIEVTGPVRLHLEFLTRR